VSVKISGVKNNHVRSSDLIAAIEGDEVIVKVGPLEVKDSNRSSKELIATRGFPVFVAKLNHILGMIDIIRIGSKESQ